MTGWIDFAIQMAFLISLWFLVPPASVGYAAAMMAGRNPGLLASRPDWQKSLNDCRGFLWVCYGIGVLSIAALASFQLGVWSLDQIGWVPAHFANDGEFNGRAGLVAASTFVSAPVHLVWISVVMLTWRRRLPLAPRRQATLEFRQFGAYVPAWLWALAISLMALSLAASAVFAALDESGAKVGWAGLISQALLLVVLLGAAFWSVRRSPNLVDSWFGARYRRYETRGLIWSVAILSALNLLALGLWAMGHPPGPLYYKDLMLLLFTGMVTSGTIWNKLNAPKPPRDHDRQEQTS